MGMVYNSVKGHTSGGMWGRPKGRAAFERGAGADGKKFIPALGVQLSYDQILEGAQSGLGIIGDNAYHYASEQAGNPGQKALIDQYMGSGAFVEAAHAAANGGDAEAVLAAMGPHPEAIHVILRDAAQYISSHF